MTMLDLSREEGGRKGFEVFERAYSLLRSESIFIESFALPLFDAVVPSDE